MSRFEMRDSGNFVYKSGNFIGTFRPIPIIGKLFGWYYLTWRYHS